EPASVEKMAFPLPDRPSIAILPFMNMSGDPEQEYFSDGLTEDLITDLSKFSGMFVISRNSVFLYKGKAVNPKQVSEELGVRYVLEGSVRKSGDRVRITAQLIDAISGGHLWAERYDRDLKDIFALQDELVQQILSALRVKVRKVEQERALRKATANLNAYDYNHQGWWYYHRYTKEENTKARKMFEKAIELEPTFASAYVGLGFTFYEQWARLWSQDPRSLEKAYEWAKKSIAIDDAEAGAHALLGHVYLWKKQHAQAITERETAITLDPNNADLYSDLAETMVWAGRPEEAVVLIKKAMRLNPHYPVSYEFTLGFAYFSAERYEEAIAAHKKALTRDPDHFGVQIMLAMAYGELGHEKEAHNLVALALRANPQLSIEVLTQRLPIKDPLQSERYIQALLKVGIPARPPLTLPDKPSIAVLPFTNMSDDPKQEYFSDGITEDLITDLSKISGLFVIARNSVFIYKKKAVKVTDVGRELGVRYVLEGSVRKAGDRVRITAQLIDANTGGHLWAERYDRELKDIFTLQDEVTNRIVKALAVRITEDEQLRLIRKGTDNLEAYDYVLRGLEYFSQITKEANVQARKMFEKAIDLDTKYALAYSLTGGTYMLEWSFGWSQDPRSVEHAFELTQRALNLDDSLHIAHQIMGDVYLWKKQHEMAISSYRKAITLNPNDADGYYGLGSVLNWAGQSEEAGRLIKKAMRLNPKYPVWYLWALAHSHYLNRKHNEAIEVFTEILHRNPNFLPAHPYLAAIYHELGREEEAREQAAKLTGKSPNTPLDAWKQRLPYKNQADLDRLFKALQEIGMN
ncbi:tetratricopeptide repeat protein, partial [Thermodesulfobacteriota bacterium]